MKYTFLFLGLLLSNILFSQGQKELKDTKAFKIQGGYFFDGHPFRNFSGFNLLNLGLIKASDGKVKGLDLEMIFFDVEDPLVSNQPVYWGRYKLSGKATAYNAIPLFGDFNNGLFFGPMVSAGFVKQKLLPPLTAINTFPDIQSTIKLGAGLRMDYYLSLSSKIYLTLSSKLTLLDFGFERGRIENPALPINQQKYGGFDFDFIEKQFPFMLGLSFPFGK